MTFSVAEFQNTIDEMNTKLSEFGSKLDTVPGVVNNTVDHWYIPDFVAEAVIWCGQKVLDAGSWFLDKIGELLQGVAAPITFFGRAGDWRDQLGAPATEVAGDTAPSALRALLDWTGEAATRYKTAVSGQPTAATQIDTVAGTVATALTYSAVAGLAFYVALAVIVVQALIGLIGAIVLLGSMVLSWAGAAAAVGEITITSAAITAAVALLVAALGAQAKAVVDISGESNDMGAFPGGAWPKGTV